MNTETWIKENIVDKNLESEFRGKKIAMTGTTGGLGLEICSILASFGANLFLLDRNIVKSNSHKNSLKKRYPDITIDCIAVDLEDITAVKSVCDKLIVENIDIFLHNAGAYTIPRHKCSSSYDNIFQINFASPYYIIKKLLPTISNNNGRVIAVGSIAHNYSKIDESHIDFSKNKKCSRVYGNAKRLLMFSLFELFKNETKAKLSVVHPGITFTNIFDRFPKPIYMIIKYPMKIIFMKPKKAALSIINGFTDHTLYHEWIGPRIFDIFGLPKKRKLNTCSIKESEKIAEIAQVVYEKCEKVASNIE